MPGDDRIDPEWMAIPDPIAAPLASGKAPAPAVESPTRGAIRMRRSLALAALVVWPALVLARWGLRPEMGERSSFVLGQSLVFTMLLISAGFVAISAGRRGLGRSVTRARVAAVGAPLAFMLIGLVWLPSDAQGGFGEIGPARAVVSCLLIGLLVVVPVLFAALWAMRRAFPAAAAWRGAALGAAVGLAGSVALTLHCGSSFGGHVALAHGLPIVIAALAGSLLGTRIARS